MQKFLTMGVVFFLCSVVQAGDLSENGMLSRKLTLINSISYQQYGICFVGKVSVEEIDAKLALFQAEEGKKVFFQAVPDPDGKTYSLYADINHSDPDYYVLPYGSLELAPEKQQKEKPEFKSSLSVDAKTGKMENGKIRLKIDKTTGTITSLRHNGIEHDLVQKETGLNGLLFSSDQSVPKSVRLTQIADAPLVAVMLVETCFSDSFVLKTQITVFADSEKFKIENHFEKWSGQQNEELRFAFPLNVQEGKWRKEPTYLTFYGEKYGVDWTGHEPDKAQTEDATLLVPIPEKVEGQTFEYWFWPYVGPFSEEVGTRFAEKIQKPMRFDEKK